MTSPFVLLTVCTGNVCRSPAAERLLAHRLGPTVRAHSAGTHALVGDPIHGPMVPLVEQHDGSASDFTARQIGEQDVRGAQLILALTREHRAIAVDLWPGAVRRSFTLREFARIVSELDTPLTGDTPSARLAQIVPVAAASRTTHPAVQADDDDVIDPYRRTDDVYRESMGQILTAVEAIAAAVL